MSKKLAVVQLVALAAMLGIGLDDPPAPEPKSPPPGPPRPPVPKWDPSTWTPPQVELVDRRPKVNTSREQSRRVRQMQRTEVTRSLQVSEDKGA